MRKPFKHLTNLLRFNRGAEIPTTGPIKAEWEIINTCNAKCLTCLHWKEKSDSKILSTAQGKSLIQQLARSGLLNLYFTGGEPLLRKDLAELLSYAKKYGLSTALVTNGLLISERRARELVNTKLDTIYISIDAAEADLNDEIRGLNGYFDLALAAIDNLKSMCRNGNPRIFIKATISCKNVDQIVPLAKLANRKGIEGFSFQLAQLLKNANFIFDESLLLGQQNRHVFVEQMELLIKSFSHLLTGSIEYYQALQDYVANPESLQKYRSISGFSFVQIDPYGRIFTCPAKDNQIGDFRENTFEKIWFGQIANNLRQEKEANVKSSYLFETLGNMNVAVSDLSLKRFFKLVRPILNGAKLF